MCPIHRIQICYDKLHTPPTDVHDEFFVSTKLNSLLHSLMDVMRLLIAINQGNLQASFFANGLYKGRTIAGSAQGRSADGFDFVNLMLRQDLGIICQTIDASLERFSANGANALRCQFDKTALAKNSLKGSIGQHTYNAQMKNVGT